MEVETYVFVYEFLSPCTLDPESRQVDLVDIVGAKLFPTTRTLSLPRPNAFVHTRPAERVEALADYTVLEAVLQTQETVTVSADASSRMHTCIRTWQTEHVNSVCSSLSCTRAFESDGCGCRLPFGPAGDTVLLRRRRMDAASSFARMSCSRAIRARVNFRTRVN